MFGKDMASAGFAPFAIALRRFVIRADILFTLGNLHTFRLPQGEGIDGTSRPVAARAAVTIAHTYWLTCQCELDRTTETTAIQTTWLVVKIKTLKRLSPGRDALFDCVRSKRSFQKRCKRTKCGVLYKHGCSGLYRPRHARKGSFDPTTPRHS